MKNYFITATDTDAGKTFVACALIQALIKDEHSVAAYKPVAAGCQQIDNELVNEDAQLLSHFANCNQLISEVNPIALVDPIAPHIAASKVSRAITIAEVTQGFERVLANNADINITEGAGGWRLPLNLQANKTSYLSDFVKQTKQDVILVINMKLGCLNHALLTYQAIIADGLNCVAWVANSASEIPISNLDENIASLEQLLPMPKIAQFDFYPETTMSLHEKICMAAQNIDLASLTLAISKEDKL